MSVHPDPFGDVEKVRKLKAALRKARKSARPTARFHQHAGDTCPWCVKPGQSLKDLFDAAEPWARLALMLFVGNGEPVLPGIKSRQHSGGGWRGVSLATVAKKQKRRARGRGR